jgi:predicted transcriptional regulator
MNKDVLLSLGKLKGIESAEIISSSIFSAISEDAQETYSDKMDQTTDFGYSKFSSLYSDLIQNEYTEEEAADKIEEVAEPMIEAYARQYADLNQISYSTEVFNEVREQISQVVYSQIEEDLNTLNEASNMSMAEFAESLGTDEGETYYATFEEIDQNEDGMIERDEWVAAGMDPELFDKIDKDQNGVIDHEEFDDYVLTM